MACEAGDPAEIVDAFTAHVLFVHGVAERARDACGSPAPVGKIVTVDGGSSFTSVEDAYTAEQVAAWLDWMAAQQTSDLGAETYRHAASRARDNTGMRLWAASRRGA